MAMDYTKYVNTGECPKHPSHPRIPGIGVHCGTVTTLAREYREYADKLEVYEVEMDEFGKQVRAFDEGRGKLLDEFWLDAFIELGIPADHPKAAKMMVFAWEKGHASGLPDVFHYLIDAWGLIR